MNPLAEQLNQIIERRGPHVFSLLSERGRKLYWPRGILYQSAQANEKAHRYNATIGEATEGEGPMALRSVLAQVPGLPPADVVRYAPGAGKLELRRTWREKMLEENPTLRGRSIGMPIVTSAITHGLSLVGDLFVGPGDRVLLPNMYWENYDLTFETRLGARIETFSTYQGGRFDTEALRAALLAGPEKTVLILNFPNNPTGYMPGRQEAIEIRDAVVAAAEAGKRLCLVIDDAYYGLVFDDEALQESIFGYLANVHERVLTIRLDGATKELFVWGLRCGFLTYAPPPVAGSDELLDALEKKTMGAIRGAISSSPALSQSIVLRALLSPTIEAERRGKLESLRARARMVKDAVYAQRYRESWDVYPFNAGYFMCLRVKGVDAERLRVHLLEKHGVGLIANGPTDLRVAFSCLEERDIEPLFELVHLAIGELRGSPS
jgi:aspartate/methionine/tyrosine aminotransferase